MGLILAPVDEPYTGSQIEALVKIMNDDVAFLAAVDKDDLPSQEEIDLHYYRAAKISSHLSFREEVFDYYGGGAMLTLAIHSVSDEALRLYGVCQDFRIEHQTSRNLYAFLALVVLGVAVAILILR